MKSVDYSQPPWKVEHCKSEHPDHIRIVDRFHNEVSCLRLNEADIAQNRTAKANANLIVAAPNLLEALTQLLDRLSHHGSIDMIREEGPIADAYAAIAKVEGDKTFIPLLL